MFDLEIDRIVEVKWDDNAIERLTYDTISDRMQHIWTNSVTILWQTYGMKSKSPKDIAIVLRDKFERIVTIAAETVAETDEKPLYRVSCRAIGTGIEAVEKNLISAFHRAKVWNCILLLEDIDYCFEAHYSGGYEEDPRNSALLPMLLDISRKLQKMNGRYIRGWVRAAPHLAQLQSQRPSCVSFASDPETCKLILDIMLRTLVTERTIRSSDFSTDDATAIVP